jgi:glycosyltransferase involved in cell wall biosynthesis
MGAGKVVMEFCSQASEFGMECLPVCIVRGRRPTNEYVEALRGVGIRCEVIHEQGRFDPRGLIQLAGIVRRFRPDVFEAHGYRETLYLLALHPFHGFKCVTYFHGWTEASYWTREDSLLCQFLLRLSPLVVTVCNNFKERLCRQGLPASKIHVFYNGINPELCYANPRSGDLRKEYDIGESAPVVAVIGRLSGEKGQINFLKAFALVAKKRSEARAFIVGDGPDREALESLTREMHLDSQVVFTGYWRDVQKVYEGVNAVVVPSKSEGMPNVVLEAMVFGVPVLSTCVGGIPEIIEHGKNGMLVPPEDPAKLAEALLQIMTDGALAKRLASSARKELQTRFSTLERCEKIGRFYRQLIER